MLKRWRQEGGPDPRSWMLTFSDLVTLLLTFFVMMLAVRMPEVQRLRQAFGAFHQVEASRHELTPASPTARELQRLIEGLSRAPAGKAGAGAPQVPDQLDLPDAPEALLPEELQKGLSLRREQRGLVITLANDVTFGQGSAELSPRAREQIHRVAELLKHLDAPVSVEGHSDSLAPPASGRYHDNWELSLARARAVLEVLWHDEGLDPARLRVGALADIRPLRAGDSPADRAANRRTEIVILDEGR